MAGTTKTIGSTTTVNLGGPSKPRGWCEEQGIEHAWQTGPSLTVNPPIATRYCMNCGKRQHMPPTRWEDSP